VRLSAPALSPRWLLGAFAALAFLVPMLYAYKVNHIWEDYLITFRHSENLCSGQGLVYQPGERVHGFTSPLGVLLPALAFLLTAKKSYLSALWLFRVFSSLAFAGAGVLLLQTLRRNNAPVRAVVVLALLFLLEVKTIEFVTDGMETGFMLFFFAAGLYLATTPGEIRWLLTGLCWAGLLWTRPDGVVYILALVLATALFSQKPWGQLVKPLIKAGVVVLVVYGPWLLWAWHYYGSPVPNTITAKSAYQGFHAQKYSDIIQKTIDTYPSAGKTVFGPIYLFNVKEWPIWYPGYCLLLSLFCSIYWLFPIADRVGRAASLCFVVLTTYMAFIPMVFPWYVAPILVCGLVVLASGVVMYAQAILTHRRAALALPLLVLGAIGGERAWLFHETERSMRIQQQEIETNVRTEIGKWLKDRLVAGDRVYLEPIGYIGYFSQAKILDTPGLVAPEFTRLLKTTGNTCEAALALRPEWLVVRPQEWMNLNSKGAAFSANYKVAKVFDARPALHAMKNVPNRSFLLFDACFLVCQRNKEVMPIPSGGLALGSEASERYLGPGWECAQPGAGERWTVDRAASLRFKAEARQAYRLTMKLRPYLLPGRDDERLVRVRLNGTELREFSLREPGEVTLDLPAVQVEKENQLTLEMPNVQSPRALGLAEETRMLGVAVASVTLEKAHVRMVAAAH
jgi:4-amino-4-deoxy-L-arabinose transferase-like glycosyltransferase